MKDEDREDLIAYLDGELDETASREVEAKINLDPSARAEAEALRQAWDMLDYLPRPAPSPNFTHRTLERIAIPETARSNLIRPPRWRRWAVGLGWAAALLLAAGGSFALANWLTARTTPVVQETAEIEDVMVQHLRVLQNRRQYELADDLEFLRGLDQPDLFGEDGAGS